MHTTALVRLVAVPQTCLVSYFWL